MVREARWSGLGVLLVPGVVWAEVLDKQHAPWEPTPVLVTLALCVLCVVLTRGRRREAWGVACGLSVVWAAYMLQSGVFDSSMGGLLRMELSQAELQAYRGLVVMEALLPGVVTLGALLKRRLRPQGA